MVATVAADDTKAAESAGNAFLALVDAGKYDQAYKASAAIVTSKVTEKDFVAQVGDIRTQLGAVKNRHLSKVTPSDQIPGAPKDMKFIVLEFSTDFANKGGVTEIVSPMLEKDGKWRVAGYRFK